MQSVDLIQILPVLLALLSVCVCVCVYLTRNNFITVKILNGSVTTRTPLLIFFCVLTMEDNYMIQK